MKHIELSKIVSKAIFEQRVYGLETAAHARMTIGKLLPASDIDDEIEDRKISKHVEDKYMQLGITLRGVRNIPEKQMLVGTPGPLFFECILPKGMKIVKISNMWSSLIMNNDEIAKIFFKQSAYDSRAYIKFL
jgi:hypothetical protein